MPTEHNPDTRTPSAADPDGSAGQSDTDTEFVDPADLTIQRNGDGRILPETVDAGSLGKVKAVPMAYGDVQERFGDGQDFDIPAAEMADLFRDHIAQPDLEAAAREQGYGGLDAEYVNDMKPLVPRDLLLAIMDASGVDADVEMDNDGEQQAQVSVDNPGN